MQLMIRGDVMDFAKLDDILTDFINNNKLKVEGQTLHAKKLGFIHPSKNEYVEFNSELPEYFQKILNRIK